SEIWARICSRSWAKGAGWPVGSMLKVTATTVAPVRDLVNTARAFDRRERRRPDTMDGMTDIRFGYTLMTEQAGPKDLVRFAVAAEERGFDFEVSSDHYFPWLSAQGHSPYAWTVLGAVAHATERV